MYLDEVTRATDRLLTALPVPDRESEMDEVEATANGFLNLTPDRQQPGEVQPGSVQRPADERLVEKDQRNRLAMSAETPSELVTNLLPADGHLD
jgi:hypothetical protein